MSELAGRLLSEGYARAAGGDRGDVYLPPGGAGHAVKVFPADDVAYLSFVRYAIDAPSPHLPRILHGPVDLGDDEWAVVLERLSEPDPEHADFLLDQAEGFLLEVVNGDRTDAAIRPGRWGDGLDRGQRETLLGIGATLLRGHGFIPDGSGGNAMLRGDVPVFTDVVCGRSGRPYAAVAPPVHDDAFEVLLAPHPSPAP